jgi:RNA polymerase sigma factor (sigma-70 family)
MDPKHFQADDLPRLLATDLKQYCELFVEYYWVFVRKQACQLTRSDEEAEDLRQDVFLCVLRTLERKTAEEIEKIKFQGYLRSTTVHCYINRSRSNRQPVESLDTPEGRVLQEMLMDENMRERQPEIALEDKEFRRKIAELLNTLPLQQHVAVWLKHGCGWRYPDIAQVMWL